LYQDAPTTIPSFAFGSAAADSALNQWTGKEIAECNIGLVARAGITSGPIQAFHDAADQQRGSSLQVMPIGDCSDALFASL
jgi:hypothetical protein